VLELLKEDKTISQLAAQYKVHPNVLRDWRTLTVKKLSALFGKHVDVAR
jgi:transposase-like protein